jgi:hypothetical protein
MAFTRIVLRINPVRIASNASQYRFASGGVGGLDEHWEFTDCYRLCAKALRLCNEMRWFG